MVYRILKIINRILFGLMTLAFLVCLAYTLTAPVVQASMQQAQQSAEQIAATATDAIQAELTRQTDDALSGVRASLDGAAQALAGVWATSPHLTGRCRGRRSRCRVQATSRRTRAWRRRGGSGRGGSGPRGRVFVRICVQDVKCSIVLDWMGGHPL